MTQDEKKELLRLLEEARKEYIQNGGKPLNWDEIIYLLQLNNP